MKNVNVVVAILCFFMIKFLFYLVFFILIYYNAGIRFPKKQWRLL